MARTLTSRNNVQRVRRLGEGGLCVPVHMAAALCGALFLVPAAAAASVELFTSLEVRAKGREEVRFEMPELPAGQEAVLAFKARVDWPKAGGFNPALRLSLNGSTIRHGRLLNKKLFEERVDGRTQSMAAGDRFAIPYAPDWTASDKSPQYALANTSAYAFQLRVTDLLKQGTNTLVIECISITGAPLVLVCAGAKIDEGNRAEMAARKRPPTGELPVLVPKATLPRYTVRQLPGKDLAVTVAGTTFLIASEFSIPEARWVKASNAYFTWKRQVEKGPSSIVVRDTFRNLMNENLPLQQRHRVPMKMSKVWLAGLAPRSLQGTAIEPANPTVFGAGASAGIGLMPLDDVFQVHVTTASDGKAIYLRDDHLVLRPKATHTTEWAIVPVSSPDYFAFVNAARRLRGVNFTIPGPASFLRADPVHVGRWSDEKVAAFIRNRSARFLITSIDQPRYKGLYPHGTVFQALDLSSWRKETVRRRHIAPDVKLLGYFHCFMDVDEEAAERYSDARLLDAAGNDVGYRDSPKEKLFLPTMTNTFGRDIAKNVDVILNDVGMDGIYWDELEYSYRRYHYGSPWDGVSADIDPKTLRITRLKSAVSLITQPFRVDLAKSILARGPLIGNDPPHTRTMTALHFPRFVETGSISNCTLAQLFTPIALGDHLTEQGQTDAYRTMLHALDYGCVYYWYADLTYENTHPTLTEHMYPITPIELHKGYIIGAERIVTSRSGLFGWDDDSGHEAHVYDDNGAPVRDHNAPSLLRTGKRLTELRLPEGWSAAIVRLPAKR